MKIKIELELDTNDIDDSQALDDLLDIIDRIKRESNESLDR